MKGDYVNGNRHGMWFRYQDDGEILMAGRYLYGEEDGIWKYVN